MGLWRKDIICIVDLIISQRIYLFPIWPVRTIVILVLVSLKTSASQKENKQKRFYQQPTPVAVAENFRQKIKVFIQYIQFIVALSHQVSAILAILLVPWLHIVKTVYKRIFACKLTNNICVIILVRCRGPHLLFATRLHTSYLGWCRESAEGPAT